MSGKISFFIQVLAVVITAGCAQPKYVSGTPETPKGSSNQETKLECQVKFSSSGLCLTWYWEQQPTSTEVGSFIFKTYRPNLLDKSPIEVDLARAPEVILWMPSMGHGSTPTETVRIDQGTYRTSNVFFIMPGIWEIRVQVKSESEVVDEAVVNLEL